MDYGEVFSLDFASFLSVVKPIKKARPIKDNPLIIGWDTEFVYRGGEQELLSIQLYSCGESSFIPCKLADSNYPKKTLPEVLGNYVIDFAKTFLDYKDDDIPSEIYLVSHFSQAEFSNIEDLDRVSLFQANKALLGKWDISLGKRKIRFINKDLYGLLSSSLDKIGQFFGIEKISLDGVGGHDESYWKDNMDLLYKDNPLLFREYAIRDAEICYHAYTKLRDYFIFKFGIDILHFNTIPSISSYIFRKNYLADYITPVRTIREKCNRRRILSDNSSKYYQMLERDVIYGGDLNIRLCSLLAYHGGRVESFYYGRLEDVDLAYYDVDSLYPSSAILQPLPVKDTQWHKLPCGRDKENQLIKEGEGFIEVAFSFPKSTMYPCLPIRGRGGVGLYFPLDGISWCTLSELRLALRLGLKDYKVLNGFAFLPGDKEVNHPLRKYMLDLHQGKKESNKASIDYSMYKLLMNSLVGKLIERLDDDDQVIDLIKCGLLSPNAYNRLSRKMTKPISVGSLFLPEYASLVLGKARSIIGEFVAKGSYLVSTDSVLLPANVDISCHALDELKSIGSNLKYEFPVSHGVIIRTRLYALNPLEDDSSKRHIASHSVSMPKSDFLDLIRYAYETKTIPELGYTSRRLIRFKEAMRRGIALNSEYEYSGKVTLYQDGKRRLDTSINNPFAESSWSYPLSNDEIQNRKSKVNLDEVMALYESGKPQADIARHFGVSRAYICKVVKQFAKQVKPLKEDRAYDCANKKSPIFG